MYEVRSTVVRDLIEKCKFESDALLVACKHVLENEAAASVYATDEANPVLIWKVSPAWNVVRNSPPGWTLNVEKQASPEVAS